MPRRVRVVRCLLATFLVAFVFSAVAFGQTYNRKDDIFLNRYGQVGNGAKIYLCKNRTTALPCAGADMVRIYSDAAGTVKPNPIPIGANANYFFYVDSGDCNYKAQVQYQGQIQEYPDQSVCEGGAGTVPDATTLVRGKVQLAGDLGGTATSPTVPALANKLDRITTNLAGLAAISSPVEGQIANVTDGQRGEYVYKNSTWRPGQPEINVQDFGARGDGGWYSQVQCTSGSGTLSNVNAITGRLPKVGDSVVVSGCGPAGANLLATISGGSATTGTAFGTVTLGGGVTAAATLSARGARWGSSTDDTAAFNAAITYCNTVKGCTIKAPNGTYFVSNVVFPLANAGSSIRIIGTGRLSSWIIGIGADQTAVFQAPAPSGGQISVPVEIDSMGWQNFDYHNANQIAFQALSGQEHKFTNNFVTNMYEMVNFQNTWINLIGWNRCYAVSGHCIEFGNGSVGNDTVNATRVVFNELANWGDNGDTTKHAYFVHSASASYENTFAFNSIEDSNPPFGEPIDANDNSSQFILEYQETSDPPSGFFAIFRGDNQQLRLHGINCISIPGTNANLFGRNSATCSGHTYAVKNDGTGLIAFGIPSSAFSSPNTVTTISADNIRLYGGFNFLAVHGSSTGNVYNSSVLEWTNGQGGNPEISWSYAGGAAGNPSTTPITNSGGVFNNGILSSVIWNKNTRFAASDNLGPSPVIAWTCTGSCVSTGGGAYSSGVWLEGPIFRSRKIRESTAAPASGTWTAGDFVWNTNPTTGIIGWSCNTGGTPGTWTAVYAIDVTAPPALGATTPNTGKFTTINYTSALQHNGTPLQSSDLSDVAHILKDNAAAAVGAFNYDLSGLSLLKLRVAAGLTTATNGEIGYDSTALNWHAWKNGADNQIAMYLNSLGPANGDCVKWVVSGSTVSLGTAGGACGTSTGAPVGATYITEIPDGTLSSEFAMSTLATGLVKNTTTTGVPTIAVAGTDYVVPAGNVATATALAANGTNCGAGSAAGGVDASGNAESCITPIVNPMTTLGDAMYGGAAGAVTRLAGPTTPNSVPQYMTSTPSGGVATAPTWTLAGVAGRAVSITSDTIAATDRTAWITYSNAGAIAVTLPSAASLGSNFAFGIKNIGVGPVTVTPTTSTIDGNATIVITQGQNCTIASLDNTNYVSRCSSGQVTPGTNLAATPSANGTSFDIGPNVPTQASNGAANQIATYSGANKALIPATTLPTAAEPAHTGDATNSAGSLAMTVVKVNGTTVPTNAAADQTVVTTASATGSWASLPNCGDATHGLAYATSTHTYSCQSITGTAGGMADPGGNGIMARTALNTSINRTITGTANRLGVVNGDGVSGNPTLDVGTQVNTSTVTPTTKQIPVAAAADRTLNYIDYPDVKIIPAAACSNTTAGAGWNIPASGVTAACRAGTNNLGGALQMTPSAGTGIAQFEFELAGDWDTGTKPYIAIYYGSGSNTSGTVIWTVSTACTKQDGSVTDDPSFIAESAMGTQTMAAASRMWAQSAQLAGAMTNCIAGSTMIVKVAATGTASSAINVYKAVITTPRLLTVQAN